MSDIYGKKELIRDVGKETPLGSHDIEGVLALLLTAISQAAESGKTVNLPGFGRFSVKERAARIGRNPGTGAEVQIPASRSLCFKASKGGKAVKS